MWLTSPVFSGTFISTNPPSSLPFTTALQFVREQLDPIGKQDNKVNVTSEVFRNSNALDAFCETRILFVCGLWSENLLCPHFSVQEGYCLAWRCQMMLQGHSRRRARKSFSWAPFSSILHHKQNKYRVQTTSIWLYKELNPNWGWFAHNIFFISIFS